MEITLRERKKTATREALHDAALRLAVDRGLDAVTVEAIADVANVSRRTFSNYFANKEEALLYGDRVRIERLLETLRSRPPTEPPWRALTESARLLYAERDLVDRTWLTQMRLVRQHPSLLAQLVAAQSALERDLVVEVAARLPAGQTDPLYCRMIAAVFLAVLRAVFLTWSEQDRPESLSDLVVAGLNRAGEGFD